MVAISPLSGIDAGPAAEFIDNYPLNLEPIVGDPKIGKGQLKAPPGSVQVGTAYGPDRGGIVWNARHMRVFGSKLCEVAADGTVAILGDVGDDGKKAALDYGFDRLSIGSNGNLFYFDGTALTQVTDTDLGTVVDAIWIDGYTMTTDGTYVIVNELDDPYQIKPLKYGSAESDPDPVTGLLRYREEAYVFNRNTVQTFQNVGGNGFPFQTVRGGTIPYGCVAPAAKCKFGDGFAFVGSGRNEQLDVFAGGQGQATPFGNRGVRDALNSVEDETAIEVEERNYGGELRLLVHLPDESWCFCVNASKLLGQPIWYRLSSGERYRLRHMVLAYGKRWVGDSDSGAYGYLDDYDLAHWGAVPEWQFEAGMLYNHGQGFIIHSVEIVGLPGRGQGAGSIFMSMTRDGVTYSTERSLPVALGARTKRLQWRPHSRFGNYMGFRFRGHGAALPGIAAVEAAPQPLDA